MHANIKNKVVVDFILLNIQNSLYCIECSYFKIIILYYKMKCEVLNIL